MNDKIVMFGPAGNSEDFFEAGNKSALEAPKWLREHNLDCYEYQCGHGVKISEDSAEILGKRAKEFNIKLSVHSPYYISLSSVEKEKRDNSIKYIMDTLRVAKIMGADRIVVHSGSCAKMSRKDALLLAEDTLLRTVEKAENEGYGDIFICPETMGKINQLGTVEEVIKLCSLSDKFIPTIDFGHVNAQTLGTLKGKDDFLRILELMDKKLNKIQSREFHSHFSRIEYTAKGEKKHRTLSEREYEPDFEPLAEALKEGEFYPRIICESAGTQTADAVEMKKIYLEG